MTPEKLIAAAKAYQGKLLHIVSNGKYITFDLTRGNVANDFSLFFANGDDDIPLTINEEVARRIQAAQNDESDDKASIQTQPNMNCWEFCMLSLYDVGMVSKEQIQRLRRIQLSQNIEMVYAFYKSPLTSYKKLPAKGDILLFQAANRSDARPYHAAIALDENNYIELIKGPVSINRFKLSLTDKIYCIPFSEVENNIADFIKDHQNKNLSIPRDDVSLQTLKTTQYLEFVLTYQERQERSRQYEIGKFKDNFFQDMMYITINAKQFLEKHPQSQEQNIALQSMVTILDNKIPIMLVDRYNEGDLGSIAHIIREAMEQNTLPDAQVMNKFSDQLRRPESTQKPTVNFIAANNRVSDNPDRNSKICSIL